MPKSRTSRPRPAIVRIMRRVMASALAQTRAVRYATLNGAVGRLVAEGQLVQASAHLVRLGLSETEIRSFRSHFGKCVKKAYRAVVGSAPLTCWVEIDGHYRQVCVYLPNDRAFVAGVASYKRLAALVADRSRAAFTEVA